MRFNLAGAVVAGILVVGGLTVVAPRLAAAIACIAIGGVSAIVGSSVLGRDGWEG